MPNVIETTDATSGSNGTSTAYGLTSGQTAQGTLSTAGDRDWYRVDLVAGETYTFAMTGTGGSNVQDPHLRLYGYNQWLPGYVLQAQDDNSLPGNNSIFTYTATATGAFYMEAGALNDAGTGQYGISFTAGERASFDVQMGAGVMDRDVRWGTGSAGATVTWAARETYPDAADAQGNPAPFTQLTAEQIDGVRDVLAMFSEVSGLTFVQVNPDGYSNNATMLYSSYSSWGDGAGGFASYPGSTASNSTAGDVRLNTASLHSGSYSSHLILHETGHAVGLSHPGKYSAAPGVSITYDDNAQFIQDSHQYSVMSYFGETNTSGSQGRSQSSIPQTLMLHDIYALQQIYGANTSTRAGDTEYGFGSNNVGGIYDFTTNIEPVLSIWDGGGIDTLDVSGFSQDQVINLNSGGFSDIGGKIGNISIALGAQIERAKGGSGNDHIYLQSGAAIHNNIYGNDGTDTAHVTYAYGIGYVVTGTAASFATIGSAAGNDTFQGVESVVFADGVEISSANLTATTIPVVAISNVSITEGNTGTRVATFNVTRTGDTAAFTVNYATANGTSVAGSDYVAAAGSLSFGNGINTRTISVTVNGDVAAEFDETFFVNLSGATNGATIADGQGVGTVVDNDPNAAPAMTSNGAGPSADVTVDENTIVVTTVTASDPDSASLTYAIVGGADQDQFTISPDGALRFITAPDFENPTDADHDNGYIVEVRVSDGSLADSQVLTVAVADVGGVTLVGDDTPNFLQGTPEGDTLQGAGGNDTLVADTGDDSYDGGAGTDSINFAAALLGVTVNLSAASNQATSAELGIDQISNVENVAGGAGNDQITGDGKANTYSFTGGFDTFNGMGGSDTVNLSRSSAVFVDLDYSGGEVWTANGATLLVDTTSVENIIGTRLRDDIRGDANANTYGYTGGFDHFDGRAGSDTIDLSLDPPGHRGPSAVSVDLDYSGGEVWTADGATLLVDTTSVENIIGSRSNDDIRGDANANTYGYTGGFDRFDGRAGSDTIDLSQGRSAVFVDLDYSGGEVWSADGAAFLVDTASVENIVGTTFSDEIRGDGNANSYGYTGGLDRFHGFGGSDTIDLSRHTSAVSVDLDYSGGEVWTADGIALLVDTASVENVTGTLFDDDLRGDSLNNVWTGGGGNDRFAIRPGMGSDAITDFVGGAGVSDMLDVRGFGYASAAEALADATQVGADTVFDFGAGTLLTLQSTLKSSLHADDFILA